MAWKKICFVLKWVCFCIVYGELQHSLLCLHKGKARSQRDWGHCQKELLSCMFLFLLLIGKVSNKWTSAGCWLCNSLIVVVFFKVRSLYKRRQWRASYPQRVCSSSRKSWKPAVVSSWNSSTPQTASGSASLLMLRDAPICTKLPTPISW